MAEKSTNPETSRAASEYMQKRAGRARGWFRTAGVLFTLAAATFVSAFIFPPAAPLLISSITLGGLGTGSMLFGAANS